MSKILTEEEFFKYLSEKLTVTIEELKQEFEAVVTEVKTDEKFAGQPDDKIRIIARNRFHTRKIKEMASNAIGWEGIIIGIGDLIDTVATQKTATDAAFKADPMKTMKGWIYNTKQVLSDTNGKPLYPKTEGNMKFKRAGKPLPEHSWLRTIIGFARPIDPKTKQAGVPWTFRMSLNGNAAIDVSSIPHMIPIKFKGINRTTDEDRKISEYKINPSTFTKFEKADIKDFPAVEDVLKGITNRFKMLGELEEYHNQNENDKARWVITEGSVAMLNLEPNTKTGNMMMILSDESLTFSGEGDKSGVMCWIPTDRGIVIDFGVESRIFIVGRTTRGKARDPTTGELLETPGDVMLNVFDLYAPEMFKVKASVQPLTESSVVPTETDTKEEW